MDAEQVVQPAVARPDVEEAQTLTRQREEELARDLFLDERRVVGDVGPVEVPQTPAMIDDQLAASPRGADRGPQPGKPGAEVGQVVERRGHGQHRKLAPSGTAAPSMATSGDILVTGASGFVGRHVLERGASVRVASGDLRDRETAMSVVADAHPAGVIHLAAATDGGDWRRLADDVAMTGHLIDALAEYSPSAPLLVPGSAAQYGMAAPEPLVETSPLAPVSAYGARKCALETAATSAALQRGVRVIWARGFNHLGPGQAPDAPVASWARQVAEGERAGEGTVLTGPLDRVRDFLDVRDVADAYLALLGSPAAGPVNVCSGRATALGEVVELLRQRAAAPIDFTLDPALEREADPVHVVGDPAHLHALVSWRPRYALDRSVDDVLADWRERVTRGAVHGAAA